MDYITKLAIPAIPIMARTVGKFLLGSKAGRTITSFAGQMALPSVAKGLTQFSHGAPAGLTLKRFGGTTLAKELYNNSRIISNANIM